MKARKKLDQVQKGWPDIKPKERVDLNRVQMYILSHPRLTKSARPLAQKLGELLGEQILVRTSPVDKYNMVVRYGNSAVARGVTNLNSVEHIITAGNKRKLSSLLMEKDILHVEIRKGLPEQFPVFIRTEVNRGGGIGIEIAETKEQYIKKNVAGHSWSYYYPFQFELGVHILGGQIEKVFKKIRQEGLEEEKYPIRNTQRGYRFIRKAVEVYSGLPKYIEKLYEVFPIQFARLDIGYEKGIGYRLIEVNSAPDLSQNVDTLNLYAEFLADKIK